MAPDPTMTNLHNMMLRQMPKSVQKQHIETMRREAAKRGRALQVVGTFERIDYAHFDPDLKVRSGQVVKETFTRKVFLNLEGLSANGTPVVKVDGGPTGFEGCVCTTEFMDDLGRLAAKAPRTPYVLNAGSPKSFERFSIGARELYAALLQLTREAKPAQEADDAPSP